MRRLLILLISCLVLSNVASAAMVCCMDMENMDKSQNEQAAGEMPCHDASSDHASADNDDNQHSDAQNQCECQGCAQFSHIPEQSMLTKSAVSPAQPISHDSFISSEPDTVYHPPKLIS